MPKAFSIVDAFHNALQHDDELPQPIAAIFALSEMIATSQAETTSELMESVGKASEVLKGTLPNPIPASAGLELFMRFVITKNWAGGDFAQHKQNLIATALEYANNTVPSCRERITALMLPFIKNDTVILTHGYSRVVMQVLLAAAKQHKRISVYVTEGRPSKQGLRTYKRLMAEGIPCTVVLDSAVAYIMTKVDLCLLGAEGVAESGGLFNYVGSYQMGLIAKAARKPVFALAERCVASLTSFKFLRLFPLSQYDLPGIPTMLPFPSGADMESAELDGTEREMTHEMEQVDYTLPDLVTFIVSDIGILTPSGVADALLAVYGGD